MFSWGRNLLAVWATFRRGTGSHPESAVLAPEGIAQKEPGKRQPPPAEGVPAHRSTQRPQREGELTFLLFKD